MNRWQPWRCGAATRHPAPPTIGSRPAPKSATSIASVLLAAALSLMPPPAKADQIAPWTFWTAALPQMPLQNLGRMPKWLRIRDWLVSGQDRRSAGLSPWIVWARSLRQLPPLQRLILIHSRVNQAFPYASDAEVWGLADYWETPAEVVAKGRTDCEGFAIFNLWLARVAGLDDAGMGVLVGLIQGGRETHADLLVRLDGHDLILDNRRSSVVPAALIGDFRPLMVLDLEDLHFFVKMPLQGIDAATLTTDSQSDR